ncbi:DMT family transporter [Rhizobium chutanense]|uniref:EamA-like transporter family protein n=1 Tax=Rhizobium chutanense TaxID=2035448 RepID=A0A432P608_9HYPH|nr:DMT family transporter [Rhizobium chutanense]RUM07986.1 EamA-like transporter family protein [Rhizobium chutanense]
MPAAVFGILAAAGAALVAQNLLMARISASASTILIPLVLNSAVGLVALLGLLIARSGMPAIQEALGSFKVWNVLPGLLGSFFVFASILGYQRLGAAATIATLVTTQLGLGLVVDIMKSGSIRGYESAVAGALLLAVGAILVVFRPN